MLHNPVNQLSGISSIRPDFAQALNAIFDAVEYQFGSVSVLHIGSANNHSNDKTHRVNQQMPFTALDVFRCVIAFDPPFSVVFTD